MLIAHCGIVQEIKNNLEMDKNLEIKKFNELDEMTKIGKAIFS